MAVSKRQTSRDAATLEFLELAQQRVWPNMHEKRAVQLIRKRASANTACLSPKNCFEECKQKEAGSALHR